MGALASLEQLDAVRAAVETMVAEGGSLAIGSLDAPEVRRADGSVGAVEHGAFMSPVLLDWADPEAPAADPTRKVARVGRLPHFSISQAATAYPGSCARVMSTVYSNDFTSGNPASTSRVGSQTNAP